MELLTVHSGTGSGSLLSVNEINIFVSQHLKKFPPPAALGFYFFSSAHTLQNQCWNETHKLILAIDVSDSHHDNS